DRELTMAVTQVREAVAQQPLARCRVGLAHRAGQEAGIDFNDGGAPIGGGEWPDSKAALMEFEEEWHPADGASSNGTGAADLKDRLRLVGQAELGPPKAAVLVWTWMASAAPERWLTT